MFTQIELIENGITIYDRIIIPRVDDWKKYLKPGKPIKFENKTGLEPGYGMMPTFAPGVIFSFGGKDEKKRDDLISYFRRNLFPKDGDV